MFKQTPEKELDIFKVLHSPTVAPWHTVRLCEYQEVKQCYAVPYQKATAATAAPAATTAGDTQQGGISTSGSAASIGALNVITEEPDSSNSGNTSSSSSSSSTNDYNDSPKSTDAQQQQQQQQQQTEGITKLQWLALWQVHFWQIVCCAQPLHILEHITEYSTIYSVVHHNAPVLMLVFSAAVALTYVLYHTCLILYTYIAFTLLYMLSFLYMHYQMVANLNPVLTVKYLYWLGMFKPHEPQSSTTATVINTKNKPASSKSSSSSNSKALQEQLQCTTTLFDIDEMKSSVMKDGRRDKVYTLYSYYS
jgi:hypothetical protein